MALICTILAWLGIRAMDALTPHIHKQSPVAVGIYVFGYLIFFGLILHAALTTPL